MIQYETIGGIGNIGVVSMNIPQDFSYIYDTKTGVLESPIP
jgi:hypothetical protein